MTTPETLDYLAVAKANWNAVPGLDGTPEHGMSAALEYHYEFVFKPEVIVPTVVR